MAEYETNNESEEATTKPTNLGEYSLKELVDLSNVADILSKDVLKDIGEEVVTGYETDLESRMPWFQRYEKAMELAMQVHRNKSYPWPGASNIKFPLMTLACLQFHARAYPALVPSKELVNVKSIGRDFLGLKRRRAERIKIHMNYQFLDQMEEWEEDMDRLLITLPITGSEFKKVYYSNELGRLVSRHIFAKDLVVDYYATSLTGASRITEVLAMTTNEIIANQRSGTFVDCKLEEESEATRDDITTAVSDKIQGATQPNPSEGAGTREVLEQHGWYDLDEDGYKEPYIFTVDRKSRKVLRIVTRFQKEGVELKKGEVVRVTPDNYYVKFDFIPSPDGGFYGVGFGTLIYPINETVNTLINQLVDAGTLSNLQSGFISRQFKTRSGNYQFAPGEWKVVNASMQDLKQGIFPLPVREPSNVLFQLLGLLIDIGQKVTSTTDMLTGENPGQNQKATTTMAVIENGMRVFTAVYKRLRRALTKEIMLVYGLNRIYLDEVEYFNIVDPDSLDIEQLKAYRDDYEDESIDIRPTADPNAVSQFQKVVRAEALLNAIQFGAPLRPVLMRYYEALEIENPEEVLPPEQVPPPPEVIIKDRELSLKEAEFQANTALKSRELDRKEFEAQIKAQDSMNDAHLKAEDIKSTAELGAMKIVSDSISQRRKVESDKQKQQAKPKPK